MKVKKPYLYFWITAVLIVISGFFIYSPNTTLDFNIQDTYFVIAHKHMAIILGIIYAVIGFTYWVYEKSNQELNSRLTFLHTLVMTGSFVLYNVFYNFIDPLDHNIFLILLLVITLLAQPLYITNVLMSTFKKKAA